MSKKDNRILIFSGTTEGRRLSEGLSEAGIFHVVAVATGYGEEVMRRKDSRQVVVGRMDKKEMTGFIRDKGFEIVIDATHPYANIATANIRAACEAGGAEYIRVLRDAAEGDGEGILHLFSDPAGCREALKRTEGNILLTTGIKELKVFAEEESLRERLYVRILPSMESLKSCEKAGLSGHQIIAMQGPFSVEMNKALIRQWRIDCLVAKDSGSAGGFSEKRRACAEMKIPFFVIKRPEREEGITVEEALLRLVGSARDPEICFVGIGPGDRRWLTQEAAGKIREADCIFGAPRLLAAFPEKQGFPYYRGEEIAPILREQKPRKAVVLFSGDSGFFSGAKDLFEELRKRVSDRCRITVLPGISSISYLAARIGVPWSEACVISLHGRDTEICFEEAVRGVKEHPYTYLLVSGVRDVTRLAKLLLEREMSHCLMTLGYRLSYEDESIRTCSIREVLRLEKEGLYTVLIHNPSPARRRLLPLKSDGDFLRGRVPMTKAPVRHRILTLLGLSEGDVFYDVGSGTGSVAAEAASLSPELSVCAIERRSEACQLIRQNAARCACVNLSVTEGEAPEAFRGLPHPTHVFIGGSGGRLSDIVKALLAFDTEIRVVLSAITLETLGEAMALFALERVRDVSVEQMSVSAGSEAGGYHLMKAQNPVWIISFWIEEEMADGA